MSQAVDKAEQAAFKERLFSAAKKDGNQFCGDCGDPKVAEKPSDLWCSTNIGLYLCLDCAGVHRNLGTHISKMRSIQLDNWTTELVDGMLSLGNVKAAETYEANLPPGFKKPEPTDPYVMREQWIRAKYDRRNFVSGSENAIFNALTKYIGTNNEWAPILREGPLTLVNQGLFKKGVVEGHFLLTANLMLYWYKSADFSPDAELVGCFDLTGTTLIVENESADAKLSKFPRFEIKGTKSLTVQSPSPQACFEWVHAIRCAQTLVSQFDKQSESVTYRPVKEGQMEKEGANHKNWLKRWFVLRGSMLYYFADKKDPSPKGVCELKGGTVAVASAPKKENVFSISLPNRTWLFSASSKQEMDDWVSVLTAAAQGQESDQSYLPLYSLPHPSSGSSSSAPMSGGGTSVTLEA